MGKEKMAVTLDREFIGELDRLGTTYCRSSPDPPGWLTGTTAVLTFS